MGAATHVVGLPSVAACYNRRIGDYRVALATRWTHKCPMHVVEHRRSCDCRQRDLIAAPRTHCARIQITWLHTIELAVCRASHVPAACGIGCRAALTSAAPRGQTSGSALCVHNGACRRCVRACVCVHRDARTERHTPASPANQSSSPASPSLARPSPIRRSSVAASAVS